MTNTISSFLLGDNPVGLRLYYAGLLIALILLIYVLYRYKARFNRKKRSGFQPYVSSRSSSNWNNNHEYLRSRFDDLKTNNSRKFIRVQDIIQTYIRTGSIPKTAKSTGYSKRKVKRVLILTGNYTTKKEAARIFSKYK